MKLTINNSTINYFERGREQSTPIVFIHGFPFNHEQWKPQLSVLPDDTRMILYDVRGHGASDVGDGQFTIDLFADDLIALLDHLSIDRTVVCGLSMGGYISLRAYEKYPKRINGLILCDTKSESDTDEARINRSVTIGAIKESGVKNFAENFVKNVFWEKTFEINPKVIEAVTEMICTNSPLGICGTLIALAARTDTTKVLPSIDVPVCIITGEHDKLTPPSSAQSMQNRIAGSELHILPRSAHMSNLENTEDFNKALTSFLGRIRDLE